MIKKIAQIGTLAAAVSLAPATFASGMGMGMGGMGMMGGMGGFSMGARTMVIGNRFSNVAVPVGAVAIRSSESRFGDFDADSRRFVVNTGLLTGATVIGSSFDGDDFRRVSSVNGVTVIRSSEGSFERFGDFD